MRTHLQFIKKQTTLFYFICELRNYFLKRYILIFNTNTIKIKQQICTHLRDSFLWPEGVQSLANLYSTDVLVDLNTNLFYCSTSFDFNWKCYSSLSLFRGCVLVAVNQIWNYKVTMKLHKKLILKYPDVSQVTRLDAHFWLESIQIILKIVRR